MQLVLGIIMIVVGVIVIRKHEKKDIETMTKIYLAGIEADKNAKKNASKSPYGRD